MSISHQSENTVFSKLKKFFFTVFNINKNEISLFLGLSSMFALFIGSYTSVRQVKDALAQKVIEPTILPFLKVLTSVFSFVFFFVFTLCAQYLNRRSLFYLFMFSFLGYFAVFANYIFPNLLHFTMTEIAYKSMIAKLVNFINIFHNCSFHTPFWKLGLILTGISIAYALIKNLKEIKKDTLFSDLFNKTLLLDVLKMFGGLLIFQSISFFSQGEKVVKVLEIPLLSIRYWHVSLFYVLSELAGTTFLQLFFWDLTNSIFSNREDRKRICPAITLIGQVGMWTSGRIGVSSAGDYTYFLNIVCICIFLGICIHEYILFVSNQNLDVSKTKAKAPKAEKKGTWGTMAAIFKSEEIMLVISTVFFYGFTTNVFEVWWKTIIGRFYKANPNTPYTPDWVYGTYYQISAIVSFLIGLLSPFIVNKKDSLTGENRGYSILPGILTPIFTGIFSMMFFGILFGIYFLKIGTIQTYGLHLIVIGTIGATIFKSVKYTLFDNFKELIMGSVSDDIKSEAKAADAVTAKFGKTGSAIFQNVLLILESQGMSSIVFALLFFINPLIAIIWIKNVIKLGHYLNNDVKKK